MARYFGCAPEFGASVDEIAFDLTVRDLAHAEPDPHLNELLTRYGEEALAKRLRNASPLRVSVENAITPLLPHGKARLDAIARKLGMSNRTLARRLAAEGYGFAEILDALRCRSRRAVPH